jgi:hypothetical protein
VDQTESELFSTPEIPISRIENGLNFGYMSALAIMCQLAKRAFSGTDPMIGGPLSAERGSWNPRSQNRGPGAPIIFGRTGFPDVGHLPS